MRSVMDNIVFIGNQNFICNYLPTVINSIESTNSSNNFHYWVIISKSSIDGTIDIENKFYTLFPYIKFTIVEEDNYNLGTRFKDSKTHNHVTDESYLRFKIFNHLPKDKYLFLDIDIVVDGDIKELFRYETNKDKFIYACTDILNTEYVNGKFVLNNFDKSKGFNAGVLLIDTRFIDLDENRIEKLIEEFPDYNDQDLLNYLFRDSYIELNEKFDYMILTRKWFEIKYHRFDIFKNEEARNFYLNKVDPVIVHYTGYEKPWNSECYLNELWKKFEVR